jgi:hypothetical protein
MRLMATDQICCHQSHQFNPYSIQNPIFKTSEAERTVSEKTDQ